MNLERNSHTKPPEPQQNAASHQHDNAVFDIPVHTSPALMQQDDGIQYAELWKVIRGVLVVWAVAVWLLLIAMPGLQQIKDLNTAMLHLPSVFIGLGLMGAMFASYSLRSDIHMMWFLGVLLLLAGWM